MQVVAIAPASTIQVGHYIINGGHKRYEVTEIIKETGKSIRVKLKYVDDFFMGPRKGFTINPRDCDESGFFKTFRKSTILWVVYDEADKQQ